MQLNEPKITHAIQVALSIARIVTMKLSLK